VTLGEQRGKDIVFVGGCPRSGTTMVQYVLDSHPDICGGPEFHWVPEIIRLRNRLRASVDIGRISVFCSKEDVDREIRSLIEGLLLPYAERHGCPVISEKTPWNAFFFEELHEIFPEARFIFCVRDPRAVVASMLEVGSRAKEKGLKNDMPTFTKRSYSAIATIKRVNSAGFRAASRSDRVLAVTYERLVDEPEEETKRICDFLGLAWSEEMLKPGDKSHDDDAVKAVRGVWHPEELLHSNLDSRHVHKWQSQLTANQQAAITAAFKGDENLEALGYNLSDESIPTTFRVIGGTSYKLYSGLRHLKRFATKRSSRTLN
jgi:protein-tyrosine sulfotransferase